MLAWAMDVNFSTHSVQQLASRRFLTVFINSSCDVCLSVNVSVWLHQMLPDK